jgi:hypothetical protein
MELTIDVIGSTASDVAAALDKALAKAEEQRFPFGLTASSLRAMSTKDSPSKSPRMSHSVSRWKGTEAVSLVT